MRLLNLGCGTKASSHPDVVNIDFSIYLRLKRNPVLRRVTPLFMSAERRRRFDDLPDNILVHNLARGIPFPDNSADAIYHSHVLEHLDHDVATAFVREIWRVLKPGGIHRIAVPDLEVVCRAYLSHLSAAERDANEAHAHDEYVGAIISQCVRREATGTSQQRPLRRYVENLVLGDARRQGETHQWMYDRVNLSRLLQAAGFSDITVGQCAVSRIPGWAEHGLETTNDGQEYKPGSLYMECRK